MGEAAKRDVGTGANQIPDMNSFAFLASGSGYTYLPNGLILQWGIITTSANEVTVTLPIIYPNAILNVFAVSAHTPGNATTSVAAFGTYITSGVRGSFTARSSISTIGGRFLAIGY
ncbi:hypothetical protein C2U53_27795 [Citrobacter sp. CFNIH10]|nr:hypothetical protein C2U53_27795 [Citrobacter sp. CFNIH10]